MDYHRWNGYRGALYIDPAVQHASNLAWRCRRTDADLATTHTRTIPPQALALLSAGPPAPHFVRPAAVGFPACWPARAHIPLSP